MMVRNRSFGGSYYRERYIKPIKNVTTFLTASGLRVIENRKRAKLVLHPDYLKNKCYKLVTKIINVLSYSEIKKMFGKGIFFRVIFVYFTYQTNF